MKLSQVNVAVLSALAAGFVHAESGVSTFEEVIVTANKYEENLSETAGSVAVISGDEIQKQGATELYDSLNREPGVSVTGGAGRPQNITIRGMTGNRIAIIKDGISVSDGYGADDINDSAGRNSFDISTLKQIQVVKGASSTSYGSGAIGGVVILKSHTPEDFLDGEDFYVDASGTYTGISNKYRGASNLAFRSGDTSSLLSAAYWTGEESRNFEQSLYNRDVDGLSAEYTLNHELSDQLLLKAKAEFYREQMQTKEGTASVQPDGQWKIEDYFEDYTTTTYLFWAGVEYDVLSDWMDSLDTKVYYRVSQYAEDTNRLMNRDNNGITVQRREIDVREFNDELIGWSADIEKTAYLADVEHNLIYGAVVETSYHDRPVGKTTSDWNGVVTSDTHPFAPARSYTLGTYVQDSMVIDNWRALLGLRFDAHQMTPEDHNAVDYDGLKDNNSSELSPSASLAYQFTPNVNAYISYKHGYRAPGYDKIYGYVNHDFVPITPFVIIPNFELEAETSDSFEIGSKYDDGHLKLYTAVFYNQFENFMSIVDQGRDSSGNIQRQYVNLDNVETYGAEATLEYVLTDSWSAASKIGWVNGKDGKGEYIRSITPLEGNVSLDYDDGHLNGYARVNWADSMDRTPSCANEFGHESDCAQTSGWTTLDMGIGYSINKKIFVSANVINVLDRKYIRYQDVAGISQADTGYSTEPGRYFTLAARYAF
ncbi:TonB-dependent hemoglobin/transferrin/lactoferrin family receptor [Vibrio coralliilyticus]|uniref:TonB-dependent hemoglobin/transferrin/lactoferrin family receptor n=1 Tax=Vibrio coralliilyticus TaxID=190893 RepID=UPI0006CC5E63|nr:TonB-dependent hemoglobin/transferrin/lactoferrin family receptor [Vibrio coralliilyticus]AXN34404.1 TonB-dependent hemoglobin/transferrin/lactoferrin family receptor [Vibrio coralliilyticus]KPH24068.1 ligand-gated channel [Vibrio coralliilyticus]